MSNKAIALAVSVKGVLMATIIFAIAETSFVQGLITAICSAIISGSFLLVSTHITNKTTNKKIEEARTEIVKGQEDAKQAIIGVAANGTSEPPPSGKV